MLSITLSVLFSRANLIQTVSRPDNTPSDVDPLTFLSLSAKFVSNLKLLQTCTSAALFISQQFCLRPRSIRILDCQLFILEVCLVFIILVSCIVKAPQRLFCDCYRPIWPRSYLAYSLGFFI